MPIPKSGLSVNVPASIAVSIILFDFLVPFSAEAYVNAPTATPEVPSPIDKGCIAFLFSSMAVPLSVYPFISRSLKSLCFQDPSCTL